MGSVSRLMTTYISLTLHPLGFRQLHLLPTPSKIFLNSLRVLGDARMVNTVIHSHHSGPVIRFPLSPPSPLHIFLPAKFLSPLPSLLRTFFVGCLGMEMSGDTAKQQVFYSSPETASRRRLLVTFSCICPGGLSALALCFAFSIGFIVGCWSMSGSVLEIAAWLGAGRESPPGF